MATLEKRSGKYRVIFYFGRERFARSLKTNNQREALASLARLDDNLRRVELGLLTPPDDVDLVSFLLSDGRVQGKPSMAPIRTLGALFKNYFASIPVAALEQTTRDGMEIHVNHLKRILGSHCSIPELEGADLQRYIEQRSRGKGIHGRKLSAATIKKELVTLRTVWNWSFHMGVVKRPYPNRGLLFPKMTEKPPFQTFAEVSRRVDKGGLTPAEEADLWDCVFLTLPDITELLEYVRVKAVQPFIYPMFVFAAHTGARRSEMIRSLLTDLDFQSQSAIIHERKRKKGKLSTRRVPLSPLLIDVLKGWLSHHPGGLYTFSQQLEVERSKKTRTEFGLLTRDESHDHFKRTLANSKWSRLRGWHVLRHSFCSNCAARGVDQRLINAWVGHQSEEMVDRYRHLIPNQQQEAIRSVFA
ncbi:MAG TPA: site-specific integrase [Pirellulales bacterium]|jgi:integrase|nr:site-specific integrase [Pirellulales bacterium]